MAHWQNQPSADETAQYATANAEIVRRVTSGLDVHSERPDGGGVRVVFNASCAHVPAILRGGYKNRADLEREGRVTGSGSGRRTRVDEAVGKVCDTEPHDLYYGALELGGAGMRYYGDIALMLKPSSVPKDQALLYRNSYDVERAPISHRVYGRDPFREQEIKDLRGDWAQAARMILRKIEDRGELPIARLMTNGMVSRGVLDDEDYIEVPRRGSFSRGDLDHARTSVGDEVIETRLDLMDEALTPAELQWHTDRRDARAALRRARIDLVRITHEGRQRS